MSILETFYILFKSDATDVKKGVEDAKKSTDSLTSSLKATSTATEKIGGSFLRMARQFTALVAAELSVGALISRVRETANYAVELNNASKALGVNAQELDAWNNAVRRTGGNADTFQNTLKTLSEHLGGSAQTALKILPQLADAFQRIGRVRSQQYGKMLGLDEATILLLQQGRREVEDVIERQKRLGIITKQDTQTFNSFRLQLQDTGHAFRSVFISVATTVIPILNTMLKALIPIGEYLADHKDLIIGALIGIGAAAFIAAAPFVIANASVILLIASVGALIALFAIAFEDIKAFYDGNQSLIGDILNKWPLVGQVVSNAIEIIKGQFKGLLYIMELVGKAFRPIADLFSGGDKKITASIQSGKALLGTAGSSYLTSQTSTSILGGNSLSRSNNITTGNITINTQATDAKGIASALGQGLNQQLSQSNSFFDDGVVI